MVCECPGSSVCTAGKEKGQVEKLSQFFLNLYGRNDGLIGERVKLSSFFAVNLVGFCT
jgi:hypothetical protein